MYEISVRKFFSASHTLDGYAGDCSRLHGHNWEVTATLAAEELNGIGLVIDFRQVKKMLEDIIDRLDHTHLNDNPAFADTRTNPSTENIARYLYGELEASLKSSGIKIMKVSVGESRDCRASYYESDKK